MVELDEIWSQMLAAAAANASDAGRSDVADFLRLKASNDAIRSTGVKWLFDTVIEIAANANRGSTSLTIERDDPHNFAHGNSNLVGTRVMVRHGVRCLSVEAGWTRTPADGIMRGGALAFARVSHFGMPKKTTELKLVAEEPAPKWRNAETSDHIDSAELRRHLEILTT
ncbi:MAG: hypothetical protein IPK01_02595 [Acidobacteria bacterium]|nr:hypothetical protein [Acidobacteriota bacterium]